MLKIDKNVPAPGRPVKYPWRYMEVGDSFFVPSPSINRELQASIYVCGIRALGKKTVSVRYVDGGYRAWRIK